MAAHCPNPPVLWDIESDPVLAGTKLIAEAWDAAGLYQVGSFVGDAWKEWNGRFRDDARDFFRGEPGAVARLADRMLGSHAIYAHKQREAEQSINFVTCHDGFTLNDLVSYNDKHNEANGEGNRDGERHNRSWNCGVEGPTDAPEIEALRDRQVKNFLTVTLMSLGVPMILMGDEVRRTQSGNNNAYCHDNEANWFDWSLVEKHANIHRFVKHLLARRLLRDVRHERERTSLTELLARAKMAWHGTKLDRPDWGDSSRSRRSQRGTSKRKARLPLHSECLLGATGVRVAARGRSVAPVDRHVPPLAGGHRRVADRPGGRGCCLPGRPALGRDAIRAGGLAAAKERLTADQVIEAPLLHDAPLPTRTGSRRWLAAGIGTSMTAAALPSSSICSAVVVANRCMVRAMIPVHPVWWLAPRPAPLSPWKYS